MNLSVEHIIAVLQEQLSLSCSSSVICLATVVLPVPLTPTKITTWLIGIAPPLVLIISYPLVSSDYI